MRFGQAAVKSPSAACTATVDVMRTRSNEPTDKRAPLPPHDAKRDNSLGTGPGSMHARPRAGNGVVGADYMLCERSANISASTLGYARVTWPRQIRSTCGDFVAAATRPRPRFPALFQDGKEAAVGSSPTEGFKGPANQRFCCQFRRGDEPLFNREGSLVAQPQHHKSPQIGRGAAVESRTMRRV